MTLKQRLFQSPAGREVLHWVEVLQWVEVLAGAHRPGETTEGAVVLQGAEGELGQHSQQVGQQPRDGGGQVRGGEGAGLRGRLARSPVLGARRVARVALAWSRKRERVAVKATAVSRQP